MLHTVLISNFSIWWGGHSFGPRLMTDIVPFLCYFVAFNFQLGDAVASWKRQAVAAVVAMFAAVSFLIHAQGALRNPPMAWNATPDNIDQNPSRLFDWSDPQFMRWKM